MTVLKNPHTEEHATYHYSDGVNKCFDCGVTIEVDHNCMEHAVHYTTDGALGDAYDCGRCGAFLQVG